MLSASPWPTSLEEPNPWRWQVSGGHQGQGAGLGSRSMDWMRLGHLAVPLEMVKMVNFM